MNDQMMQKLQVPSSSIPGFEVFTDVSLLSHGIMLNGTTHILCFILHIFWVINIYSQIISNLLHLFHTAVCFVHNTRPSSGSTFFTQVIYSYHIT